MNTADFRTVTANLINVFKQYGREERYTNGQIIFIRNEEAKNLYFIQSGLIRVYLPYTDGTERTLCYFSGNTIIGEDAFTCPSLRIVCTNSLFNTHVYKLSADELIRQAMQSKELIRGILSFFMHKITLLHSWIFYAQFPKNEEKLACLLYTLSLSEPAIQLSHHQLASVTGMSRITTTRILNSFARKGLISVRYKKIEILDRKNLHYIFKDKGFY